MLTTAAYSLLEKAINHALRLDEEALKKLTGYAGKLVKIELTIIDVDLFMRVTKQGIQVLQHCEQAPDTIINGSPFSLLRLSFAPNLTTAAVDSGVTIIGDVEFGQAFSKILRNIDIDWEEHLSHLVGDIAAHQVGDVVRGVFDWGAKVKDNLTQNLSEYLQEELRHVPPREEVDDFFKDIATLRDAVDRVEQKIKELQ